MKLSTKGRYGLKAIVDVAVNSEHEVVSINSIALRQNLSESYLEQLLAKLKKAGLVSSTRGSNGGYRLAKEPSNIYIGEILRALEGDLSIVECQKDERCEMYDSCATKYVWEKMNQSINTVIDTMTLEEVIKNSCSHMI